MPTNLHIDDDLLAEAQQLGGHSTKRDTVNAALAEYVRRRRQRELLDLFGTLEWSAGYDYKADRSRKLVVRESARSSKARAPRKPTRD